MHFSIFFITNLLVKDNSVQTNTGEYPSIIIYGHSFAFTQVDTESFYRVLRELFSFANEKFSFLQHQKLTKGLFIPYSFRYVSRGPTLTKDSVCKSVP